MIDPEKIKLIIFDVDGTLAETDDYYTEKAAVLIGKILPFLDRETIEKPVRFPVMAGETILHFFYRLLDLVGLDSLVSKMHSKMSVSSQYKYREVEGMRDTLSVLREKYEIGILSSGGRQSTDSFIEKFDLSGIIDLVVSSEDCKYIKPHPLPIRLMAANAGVSAENCLMVGDTVYDILCARRAGASFAAVKTGFDTPLFLRLFQADLILESVNELPAILKVYSGEIDNSVDKPKDLV